MDVGDSMIYAYERISFKDTYGLFPFYEGNKDGVPDNKSYSDIVLTTSLKDGGSEYYDAYFAADFTVRVARPVVKTV